MKLSSMPPLTEYCVVEHYEEQRERKKNYQDETVKQKSCKKSEHGKKQS